jgi:tRNA pseudouridine38-40 synthase
MPRYFLELAYKGARYSGFQVQENAVTIQSEVQDALHTLFRQPFGLTGSSRTDAGVHALQNYFHFDTELAIGPEKAYNLNAILPGDITVKGIYPVPGTAHSRFDAVGREYAYFIYGKKNPFLPDRGWLYPFPLSIERLQEMAAGLQGTHDFTSFAKRNTQVKTFQCTIETAGWSREGEMLVFRVKANRFLRGMIRGLVGTMVKLGGHGDAAKEFAGVLASKDCTKADFSTPALGLLCFTNIWYKNLRRKG